MTSTVTRGPRSGTARPSPPGLARLLPPIFQRTDLAQHDLPHGPLPYARRRGRLTSEAAAAGLTGRGGAAFPVARKLAAVAAESGRPVVVGNGAEGEPASRKDKHLLWLSPHLVLDGLQLAAEAVGARQAYLYVHREDSLLARVERALAQRSSARRDRVPVVLVQAPPRFVAGEESALVNKVSGGLALPSFTPPRAYERGVGGAPTLVHNVETLAHLALIARHGAAWFRAAGTEAEPGTMLVTCYQADGSWSVGEAALGVPLGQVLRLTSEPVQAILTGGYHGTWISAAAAAALPLSRAGLSQAGGVLGAGVLAALPAGRCGLAETARVTRYLAGESAGQCGPCLAGLPRIAEALSQIARPYPDPSLIDHVQRWSGLVAERGACHHPDGAVRLVRSALAAFSAELARHAQGRCAADRPGGSRQPFLPVPPGGPLSREDWR